MKNIHVLLTYKPTSILKIGNSGLFSIKNKVRHSNQGLHIYITSSNEDINENDYIITKDGRLVQVSYLLSKDLEGCSKVILTTDQDLINDGVQAIDDEFLEWFVKNGSCDEVEIEDVYKKFLEGDKISVSNFRNRYKIIIPKEEAKQTIQEYEQQGLEKHSFELEPKQETLEEAALKYASEKLRRIIIPYKEFNANVAEYVGFINGAKWQQERSYSEEEFKTILNKLRHDIFIKGDIDIEKWFKQFKKK